MMFIIEMKQKRAQKKPTMQQNIPNIPKDTS